MKDFFSVSVSVFSRRATNAGLFLSVVVALAVTMVNHAAGAAGIKSTATSPGAGHAAPGVKFTTLHEFLGSPADGAQPASALISDSAGNLYGTTQNGGLYGEDLSGIIYKLSPTGVETILFNFDYDPNGAGPIGNLLLDSGGNLYGTANLGGAYSQGDVFEFTTSGVLNVLHSFQLIGPKGASPFGAVLRDSKDNLYGTTSAGGYIDCVAAGVSASCGVIYKLQPSGRETVLHSFTGGSDGGIPVAGLAADDTGSFYGTTSAGGGNGCSPGMGEVGGGCGTVFKIQRDGTETVLYAFTGGIDGGQPEGTLVLDSEGNLYGTTRFGGNPNCSVFGASLAGCGVVFKVTPAGKETVLHSFTGQPDGEVPTSLTGLVRDGSGNLYGTTSIGGDINYCNGYGCGTIFRVSPKGKFEVLYSFTGGSDGADPYAGLSTDGKGNFYGTAASGGLTNGSCPSFGCGVAFKLQVND